MNSTLKAIAIPILFAVLCALSVAVAIATMPGCKSGWNDPRPQVITPDRPCGQDYFSCGNGMCCMNGWICRPGYCAWGGLEPNTWGASRDGGTPERMPLLSEDEAREMGRRR